MKLAELDEQRLARLRPPPRARRFVEFAPTMLLPDGEAAGLHWDPDTEPMQAAWVRECDNPLWQVMVSVQPSQRGKSLKGTALPILHAITERRQSVAYVMPTKEKLDQQWQEKLKPMIEGCGFGGWLPEKGPGARGGKPASLTLRDPISKVRAASLFFLAAGAGGKETSLASVTAPVVVVDEADDLVSEAHLGLAFRRTRSFGDDYRVYIVSTVNERHDRDAHPVLIFYERGSRSRLHYPCVHCGGYQPLEWANVVANLDAPGYRCEHCAVIWSENDRHRALDRWRLVHAGQAVAADGTVTGPAPTGRWFSLLGSDLEYHRASLRQIVAEHANAQRALERGDRAPLRQFYQKVLCRVLADDADARPDLVESTLLQIAGSSTYRRGEAPPTCDLVTCGVDVQLRRHYWLVVGFDERDAWYILDWGRDAVAGDLETPKPEQRRDGLDRIDTMLRTGIPAGPDRRLLPFAALDTGFRPEETRPWIAERRARWIAAKGAGEELVSRMVRAPLGKRRDFEEGVFDLRDQDESPDHLQIFVAADDLLDRIAADWQAGRGHLPADVDAELVRHLTGMRPGVKKRWEPRGSRHDLLDCLVYAIALARYRRVVARRTPPPGPGEKPSGWVSDYSGGNGWLAT